MCQLFIRAPPWLQPRAERSLKCSRLRIFLHKLLISWLAINCELGSEFNPNLRGCSRIRWLFIVVVCYLCRICYRSGGGASTRLLTGRVHICRVDDLASCRLYKKQQVNIKVGSGEINARETPAERSGCLLHFDFGLGKVTMASPTR